MTNDEMLSSLNIRTDDNFLSDQLYESINNGIQSLMNHLHYSFFVGTPLQTTVTKTLDGIQFCAVNISDIIPLMAFNNILSVYRATSPYTEYKMVSESVAAEIMGNKYLYPTAKAPKAFRRSNAIISLIPNDRSSIRIEYIGLPATVSEDVEIDIPSQFHDIVLDLAESFLWSIDDEIEKADRALKIGFDKINILNNTKSESESKSEQVK